MNPIRSLYCWCPSPLLKRAVEALLQWEASYEVVEEKAQADLELIIIFSLRDLEKLPPPKGCRLLVTCGPQVTPEIAQRYGAKVWLESRATLKDLQGAIRAIERGKKEEMQNIPSSLSFQILSLTAQGVKQTAIARRVGCSPKTVQYHLKKLKGQFGVGTTAELLVEATREGLL